MNIEELKPIPNKFIRYINHCVKLNFPERFYSYFESYNRRPVFITCAVKVYKGKLYIKQVAIHDLNFVDGWVRDMEFSSLYGYRVDWYAEGCGSATWFGDGKWYALTKDGFKYFNPNSYVLNPWFINKYKAYKYANIKPFGGIDTLRYLKLFREYPNEMESTQKIIGSYNKFIFYKQFLNLFRKDRCFRTWIFNHKLLFDGSNSLSFLVSDIIYSYKYNVSLDYSCAFNRFKRMNKKCEAIKSFKSYENFYKYVCEKNISTSTYDDYYNACCELQLDMSLPKNYMPHDFTYWHDLRCYQYSRLKLKRNRAAQRAIAKDFSKIISKYNRLNSFDDGQFVALLPKKIGDLSIEGATLHHCVGCMNYDKKMIDEVSLIFFIRSCSNESKPFVTLEYSLESHKVKQIHGDYNCKPSDDVLDFVNNKWLPYVNNKIKLIA